MKHITQLLLATIVLLTALYCTKQTDENIPKEAVIANTERGEGLGSSSQEAVIHLDEAGNYEPFDDGPMFPQYDGQCRIILKLKGSSNSVSSANIQVKGYSAPSLFSTLLFSIPATITLDQWTTLNIPQGAHIAFTLTSGAPGDLIQVSSQEYGFNQATSIVGGPAGGLFAHNTETFITIPKFPPFSNESRYLCEAWCTWKIDYTCSADETNPNQPRLRLISNWSNGGSIVTETLKNWFLQVQTTGASFLVYPLSDASTINYVFQANGSPTNDPPMDFCYSITPLLTGGGPLSIDDVISNITFGTTPPIRCTSDCHASIRSNNYPHCQ